MSCYQGEGGKAATNRAHGIVSKCRRGQLKKVATAIQNRIKFIPFYIMERLYKILILNTYI